MLVTINGEKHHLPHKMRLNELLDSFEIESTKVAIEKNLSIIHAHLFATEWVEEGDQIEIVHFMGGG